MNDTPTRLPRPTAQGKGVLRFACPACGKACTARPEAAGRAACCSSCGTPIVVPTPRASAKPKAIKRPAAAPLTTAERITLTCRHCTTRFDVAARHEGKRVKCPDCETPNRVERPAERTGAKRPAALDGEQYEVYEGEAQPWAAELIASQPKSLPIACGLCGTLMHAQEEQIGNTVSCPDCGTPNVVRASKPAPKRRAMIDIDDDPLEVEALAEDTRARIDTAEYLKNPPLGLRDTADGETRRRQRKPKRLAIVRNALGCWRSLGLVLTTIGIVLVLVASLVALIAAASTGGLLGPIAWLALLAMTAGTWTLAAAVLSVILTELISESSFGGDRPRNWPNLDPTEWYGPLFYLAIAGVTAAAPGVALQGLDPPSAVRFACVSLWLLLPIVVLSQLEHASPMGVLSPAVLRSLVRSPLVWLTFYAASFAFTVGVGELFAYVAKANWGLLRSNLTLLTALVVALVMEARLIGLLAWVLEDEATTVEVTEPD